MSLILFAKNNKGFLSLFNKLTDDNEHARQKIIERIIERFEEAKSQSETQPKAGDDANDGALNIDSMPLVKYTIQRLMRGLTASKHQFRVAYSNAFAQILTHCTWLTTASMLTTINLFCDNEKLKQSTVRVSLLLVRNLFILILSQVHRLHELSWSDLLSLLHPIVNARGAQKMADLSCQTMVCLLDIMETPQSEQTADASIAKTAFVNMLHEHRTDFLQLCAKLIPSPLTSYKMLRFTQLKLIMRMYHNQFQTHGNWDLIPASAPANEAAANDNGDANGEDTGKNEEQAEQSKDDAKTKDASVGSNQTVALKTLGSNQNQIFTFYKFILQPLKNQALGQKTAPATLMTLYNDSKMWHALIALYCSNADIPIDAERESQAFVSFKSCCNRLFGFINANLINSKYASLTAVLCGIFIRHGMRRHIRPDLLFAFVLRPTILCCINKYACRYVQRRVLSQPEVECFKPAFAFITGLRGLTADVVYGEHIRSILSTCSVSVMDGDAVTAATGVVPIVPGTAAQTKNDQLNLVAHNERIFWAGNAFVSRKRVDGEQADPNRLKSSLRDCTASIKAIGTALQGFLKKHGKREQSRLTSWDDEWVAHAIKFFVRVVFYRAYSDCFNRARFATLLLTAKKFVRILLQTAWNVLPSQETPEKEQTGVKRRKTLTKQQFIAYFTDAISAFDEEQNVTPRKRNLAPVSIATVQAIVQKLEAMDTSESSYLTGDRLCLLANFVRWLRVYNYMSEGRFCFFTVAQMKQGVVNDIASLSGPQFAEQVMDIVADCVETDDMLITCLARHLFTEFGDLYNTKSIDRLLNILNGRESEKNDDDDDVDDDDEEEESSDESSEDDDDDDEDDGDDEDVGENVGEDAGEDVDMAADDEKDGDQEEKDGEEEKEDDEDGDEDEDSDLSDGDDDGDDDILVTDYGMFEEAEDGAQDADGIPDIDLERDDVNPEELERMDEALVAIFRERGKQKVERVHARKDRIRRRVCQFLLLFVNRHKSSPLQLNMFGPLLVSLSQIHDEVTAEFQKAKNKQLKLEQQHEEEEDEEEQQQQQLQLQQANNNNKVHRQLRTASGLPLWRFDGSLKKTWKEYVGTLKQGDKKKRVRTAKSAQFHFVLSVIQEIVTKNKPHRLIEADRDRNDITLDLLRPTILEMIEHVSCAPIYEHEVIGAKVLCYLCTLYRLKCNDDIMPLWKGFDLNAKFAELENVNIDEDDDEDANEDDKVAVHVQANVDDAADDVDDEHNDILWLMELWYIHLRMLLKTSKKTWYFSTEFFELFMHKNPMLMWKLVYDAFADFDMCRNSWSKGQLFVLLGQLAQHHCQLVDDAGENTARVKQIMQDLVPRLVKPVKDCLSHEMEPKKRLFITNNLIVFLKRCKKSGISNENNKDRKTLSETMSNFRKFWGKKKAEDKDAWKKKKKMDRKKKTGPPPNKNDAGYMKNVRRKNSKEKNKKSDGKSVEAAANKQGKSNHAKQKNPNSNSRKRKLNEGKRQGQSNPSPTKKRKVYS